MHGWRYPAHSPESEFNSDTTEPKAKNPSQPKPEQKNAEGPWSLQTNEKYGIKI